MISLYRTGHTVLGADTNQAILIKVKNAGALARGQGILASVAASIVPATVEAKVNRTIADKLKTSLKDQNVEADVSIVDPKNFQASGLSHIGTDLGFAVGGAGVLAFFYWLFTRTK